MLTSYPIPRARISADLACQHSIYRVRDLCTLPQKAATTRPKAAVFSELRQKTSRHYQIWFESPAG
ncbi:hypothetical protein [Pseudophaeobacter flagellatus]|uniref:hypothetical protein n=1 Tax=Pseudophaeobacter flagellatus TaxID=2899119 RepID=UPI001E3B67EA|nr:hypothetical protein [Pseudophaeobacter flagellatus]